MSKKIDIPGGNEGVSRIFEPWKALKNKAIASNAAAFGA
jgi:hypothetical protein